MDDLGVSRFHETSIWMSKIHIGTSGTSPIFAESSMFEATCQVIFESFSCFFSLCFYPPKYPKMEWWFSIINFVNLSIYLTFGTSPDPNNSSRATGDVQGDEKGCILKGQQHAGWHSSDLEISQLCLNLCIQRCPRHSQTALITIKKQT